MAENKTIQTGLSVDNYIGAIEHPQRKADCSALLELMRTLTGKEPKMWGNSIVGFGTYHYKYDSGREGTMLTTGFSNRKQAITLYIISGFSKYHELLRELGPHKHGKSCLYIKRLSDINHSVLEEMICESLKIVEKKYTILN